MRDLRYEAAYLRAALLVGLVHERDVPSWAADAIEVTTEPAATSVLAEIVSVPVELSAMREALYPLTIGVDTQRVGSALLIALTIDTVTTDRTLADRLQMLELIRHEARLHKDLVWAIKDFCFRGMLARGGAPNIVAPDVTELTRWLEMASGEGYFLFSFDREDDAAAFLSVLSQQIDSYRSRGEGGGRPSRVWTSRADTDCRSIVFLNDRALQVVLRESAPVPLASRVPYMSLPTDVREALDESAGSSLDVDEPRSKLR